MNFVSRDDLRSPVGLGAASHVGVLHGSFTTNIEVPATASEVFAAYGELPVRKKWFRMPGTPVGEHKLDFTVGGGESLAATFAPMGNRSELLEYQSQFLDIASTSASSTAMPSTWMAGGTGHRSLPSSFSAAKSAPTYATRSSTPSWRSAALVTTT